MSLELEGVLIKKGEIQQVSASFRKQEFVIETDEKYPQKIQFELTQDRCGEVDKIRLNTPIKVHFNVRGREWNGKYFVNLQAWRIEPQGPKQEPEPQVNWEEHAPKDGEPQVVFAPKPVNEDDLPF